MDQNIATILSMENKMNELDGDITEFEAAVKQSKTEQRKLKKMKLDLMEMWGVTEEQIAPHRPNKDEKKPDPDKVEPSEVKPEDDKKKEESPTPPPVETPKDDKSKAPDTGKGINLNNKK